MLPINEFIFSFRLHWKHLYCIAFLLVYWGFICTNYCQIYCNVDSKRMALFPAIVECNKICFSFYMLYVVYVNLIYFIDVNLNIFVWQFTILKIDIIFQELLIRNTVRLDGLQWHYRWCMSCSWLSHFSHFYPLFILL